MAISDEPSSRDWVKEADLAMGVGLRDVVRDVYVLGKNITQIEKDRGWCNRSGKVVLSIALQQLSDYSLSKEEPVYG